jgi:hypothetical protein
MNSAPSSRAGAMDPSGRAFSTSDKERLSDVEILGVDPALRARSSARLAIITLLTSPARSGNTPAPARRHT